jgi:type III secretory pathway component EscS
VRVGVALRVAVGGGVGDRVAVRVAVMVLVRVGERVTGAVTVGVEVRLFVRVGVCVDVAVRVVVRVWVVEVMMTVTESRAARPLASYAVSVRTKVPVTREVKLVLLARRLENVAGGPDASSQ